MVRYAFYIIKDAVFTGYSNISKVASSRYNIHGTIIASPCRIFNLLLTALAKLFWFLKNLSCNESHFSIHFFFCISVYWFGIESLNAMF